ANVSYELRTPLNAIIGFSEILGQEYAGPMNDRQKEYATAILGSSNRLGRLVNDILDLASIEAGYLELDLAEMDPRQLAAALETLGRERARSRGIDFTVGVSADVASILADERRLTQALYNLVSNAFAFTPEGGKVTVRIEDQGDALVFRVTDTGIGIEAEDHGRVFDRFERSGREAGAGLGLALVKSLIELHDGTVTLTSEPDQGTEVVCWIPRRTPGSATASDAMADAAAAEE
ncbi:MAG: HAMP domain-containing histidine kinase, partial [Alphaproteobacteria bacterium]|nr:HAMP domain-containing histidine kinase [Alphaproteobacteria bacterium]